VLGEGTWNGKPYFALEPFNGETLSQLLKGGHRFSTEEILHVGEGVGRALRAASEAGIVHGSIRPSTIVLTAEGQVKVIGYGTPRSVELSPDSPAYLSSLRYLSPEQVQGGLLNVQSDLYSLGIVLYLLATGKTPFDGFESAISLLYQVSYVDPAAPRKAGALIPADFDRLILRCLEKRREIRTSSPEALLEELEAIRSASRHADAGNLEEDRGDFEIYEDQILGEGGMGTLHRGRQISLGRPVAIKVIRGILTGSPEYVQRFRREAELLAEVNDPSVVQVFGTGTWRGRLFYAMELVEGQDLAVRMDSRKAFRVDEILDIAEGVGRGFSRSCTGTSSPPISS
jgi:serine/threonine protein kinase